MPRKLSIVFEQADISISKNTEDCERFTKSIDQKEPADKTIMKNKATT